MEVEENYDLSESISLEIEPYDPNYEEEPNPYQSLNDDTVLTLNNTIDDDFALNLDIMDEILTCSAKTQRPDVRDAAQKERLRSFRRQNQRTII